LLGKDYFRFVAANLYNKCLFWPEDGQCVLRACQIEDCSVTSVPPGLRIPSKNAEQPTSFRVVVRSIETF
uniref:ZP domain-containing protein n=1 Tax=Schistocephalus solidus TaxID=70667 RepID=A0A183TUH3_SCHSO